MEFDLNDSVFQPEEIAGTVAFDSTESLLDLNVALVENEVEDEGEENNEPDEIIESAVGMEFDSVEEAQDFYKYYGYRKGFGVVKRSNHKKKDACYHYAFSYNKLKKPAERNWDKPHLPDRRHPTLGTNCKTQITISDYDLVNNWVITKVQLEHNHILTPEIADLITTFRVIPSRFKKEPEFNEDEGMRACDNINSVIKHTGGYSNCTFTRKDARNYIDSYRKQKLKSFLGNDATVLMEYFEKKKLQDPRFFFTCSYDEDG
jgi:zinc finger SWIM domain-containing protein 3